jgi:hypothetical protein
MHKAITRDSERETFNALYHRWLSARATLADPRIGVTDEENRQHIRKLDEAERALLAEPAFEAAPIWLKFEVLESYLATDLIDNRSILALAAIKKDLMSNGIGSREL